MTILSHIPCICQVCNTKFDTDVPGLIITSGGGFYADLQPGYSVPGHTIWETQLISCPNCGYTTYGPMSCEYPLFSPKMADFVKTTLTPFVKRQKPIIDAQPSLTSKYELYALELDFLEFEDYLICDQFLRASWSARFLNREEEARRLRSLASVRYEKTLLTTANMVIEDEIMTRYLLIELYRLLGEEGQQLASLEKLKQFEGESIQGDFLIEVAERQLENPKEDIVIRSRAGLMDYLGTYRSEILDDYAYVALRDDNLERASVLFQRILSICEGPLRFNLYLASRGNLNSFMKINTPLDIYGAQAAIGLQEVWRRQGIRDNEESIRLNSLVRMIERQYRVSAIEGCAIKIRNAKLPPKSGWKYFYPITKDPKPVEVTSFSDSLKNILKNVNNEAYKLHQKAIKYLENGSIDLAYEQAKKVVSLCENEIAGLDDGLIDYFIFARIRLEAQTLVAIYQLMHNDDALTTIQYIEKALKDYHTISGPWIIHLFSFLLIMISKAYEKKANFTMEAKAKEKAFELVADNFEALFHLGRWLGRCSETETEAETVLSRAIEKGAAEKSWVEGASAFTLAKMFICQGRKVEASNLIKRSVLSNFLHTPDLWGHPFIKNNIPELLNWARSFYKSREGQNQLRPSWRGFTTNGNFNCSECNQRIPFNPTQKFLAISANEIHEWLRRKEPMGLICNKCGIFGACCWNWHTYDNWNSIDTPFFVPICPRCRNVLFGASS